MGAVHSPNLVTCGTDTYIESKCFLYSLFQCTIHVNLCQTLKEQKSSRNAWFCIFSVKVVSMTSPNVGFDMVDV